VYICVFVSVSVYTAETLIHPLYCRLCRVLAEALCLMHERGQDGQLGAEYHVINPKACTMGQLYGQVRRTHQG